MKVIGLIISLVLLSQSRLRGQIGHSDQMDFIANYTWRFYDYQGHYFQNGLSFTPKGKPWSFGLGSICGLNWKRTLLELSPSLSYAYQVNDTHALTFNVVIYLTSTDIGRVAESSNSGEVYLEYYRKGKWSLYNGIFFDPFFNNLYDEFKATIPLKKFKSLTLKGIAAFGIQFGNKAFTEGFSNGTTGIQLGWANKQDLSFSTAFQLTFLTTERKLHFQPQFNISF